MKLLYLGGTIPELKKNEIYNNTKGIFEFAADNLQKKMIKGLKLKLSNDLYIVSAPFINAYPKGYKKIFYKGNTKDINEKYVNFLNIWGIRNISRYFNMYEESKFFLNLKDNQKYIIVYSPHVPFLKIAFKLKQRDKNIKIILVVPDLPQFISLSNKTNLFYKFLKTFDIKLFYKYSNHFDAYIILTKYMNEFLNKNLKKKYIVLEGIANDNYENNFKPKLNNNENKIIITYTGTLHEKFGIKCLIDAFMLTKNKNYQLNICGIGDSIKYVKECSKIDKRIIYHGQVTNNEAINMQLKSNILINPRSNSGEFTKFSFPSKNLEYLSSGIPVIAYDLPGIPDEYAEILFYPKDNSIEALSQKINEVANMTAAEIDNYRKKVKKFLATKDIYSSTEKILKFINEV